jgi:cellulose biosynthesis protein BcsQ
MKVIVFGTLKGGTGKTTVAFNVGGILAEEHKVLFIDVDPQSNLSDNVGIDTADQNGWTIRDVFREPLKTKPKDVITKTPMWQFENLDIIASHIRLTATESTPCSRLTVRSTCALHAEQVIPLTRKSSVIGYPPFDLIHLTSVSVIPHFPALVNKKQHGA